MPVPRQLDLAEPTGPRPAEGERSRADLLFCILWLALLIFFEAGLQLGDFLKKTKTRKQTKINKRYPQRPQPLRGAWSANSGAWESDPH